MKWCSLFSDLYDRKIKRQQQWLAKNREHTKLLPKWLITLIETPIITKECDLRTVNILSVDMETTGKDPEKDQILSVGYVQINGKKIILSSSVNEYVNSHQHINIDAALVNQITSTMLEEGESLDEVMKRLFLAMKGRLLLAHGSFMEQGFIQQYILQRYNIADFPLIWIDTLLLYKSLSELHNQPRDFRLGSAREYFNLPEYEAHDALFDSIATAELYLVLINRIFLNQPVTMLELLQRQQTYR
ncbi:3'-5' exonuclease [Vibrio sp. SS-MA-C1-2]|uniref:3'-5' exonuclease n=1 Tax=Vibrio sp. SS-MA-C1-2 TaxID=2908646 RepID=UPI001F35836F|nr:3'-5' exonuclease [Vibrio sp. SS-MA-C1-2]UJF17751.1 3'-5' exonuclease [Vibrio sp. SS-MA-C1-2]